MNRSRKRASPIVLAVGALILGTAPVQAADNGTVGVTITVAAPCITVAGSFDYGTQPFGTPAAPVVVGQFGPTATNCSGTTEQFLARGSDATAATDPTVVWGIVAGDWCVAPNQYRLELAEQPADNAADIILTTVDQTFDASVAAGEAPVLRAILGMPCTGSDGAGLVMSSTITLTATF